ncbi:ribose 5-phosphate isomerase B [Ruficoccus sp. ZRK36]|uniref:ribose 5-phosphate isomerase B n=1 Tax=Ruficoccus sp. ZRK36 TaxID=2866311 RepID=UPI001C73D231|nr:ribose 5-phosphate isomerase B [Ruficoccus sp. ZRK36]QYY34557.1 ribose 5-phosphate isomerase B [Ruficoccus sp. ZRK36]
MKISLGSDHGGVDLKNAVLQVLKDMGHEAIDRGAYDHQRVDYPDYGKAVAEDVAGGRADFGVLVCTTGIGISISANKVRGIRAAVVSNEDGAEFSRRHNNANIICFGQKYQTAYEAAKFTRIFLETPYDGGRHQVRLDKISAIEQENGR